MRFTRSSFPGIGVAEMITVSPGWICTFLCSSEAINESADIGSPWLPRRQDGNLMAGEEIDLRHRDAGIGRHVEIAKLGGNVGVGRHAPPQDRHLAPEVGGDLDRLLDAVNVRRKRGDNHPALRALEDIVEGLPDDPLRGHIARPLHVGRIGDQEEHALIARALEAGEVRHPTIHRGGIELEVAGVGR